MALIRAHKFIEKYQDAGITPGGFRYELFQSATNGLEADGVVIRDGRRVWIDEDKYWARKAAARTTAPEQTTVTQAKTAQSVEIQAQPVEQMRYRCTGCLALWFMADQPKYCPGCGRVVKE